MLTAMRDGAKSGITRIILFGFLVLAVFGLILTDVGGFFRGGVASSSVAEVNGQEITVNSFENVARSIVSRNGMDMRTAYEMGLIDQILQNEIANNLMQYAAFDMGLMISDEMITTRVAELVGPLVNEKTSPQQALDNILRSQNMTEGSFLRNIRAEMTTSMLRNAINVTTNIASGSEAAYLYVYNNESRKISYIHLKDTDIKDIPASSDEVLLPFYEVAKERYAIPETRNITLAKLDQNALAESYEISEEELLAIYERDIISFEVPEQRTLAQAILADADLAEQVMNAVKDGKKSLEVATNEVNGTFTPPQNFEQNGLIEDIANPVFEASKDDIVGPIETPLGFHIMRVDNIIAPYTEEFDDVKEQLSKDIKQMNLADQMFEMANTIDDMLAGGATIEEVAESTDLVKTTLPAMTSSGASLEDENVIPENSSADSEIILEMAFSLMDGEISPVFELEDRRFAMVRVDMVTLKSFTPFDDVKDDIAKIWLTDQQEIANRQMVMGAMQSILNGEDDLQSFADSRSASIKTMDISRTAAPDAPFGEDAKQIFMNGGEGDVLAAPVPGGMILGRVDSVSLPDLADASEEDIEALRAQSAQTFNRESFGVYLNELYTRYDVQINETALERNFGPGQDNF
jgi:peptidyl-prolyl cis-trans isomerase D